MVRKQVSTPVTEREASHVLQGLYGELRANGLPAHKLTHSSWTEEFGGNGDIHIEYHIRGLTASEAGRLAHLLTKGRQA